MPFIFQLLHPSFEVDILFVRMDGRSGPPLGGGFEPKNRPFTVTLVMVYKGQRIFLTLVPSLISSPF